MAKRKKKSAKDIQEQALRILDNNAQRGYDALQRGDRETHGRIANRLGMVGSIMKKYTNNISKSLGYRNGYIPNDKYDTKVSKSIYAGVKG